MFHHIAFPKQEVAMLHMEEPKKFYPRYQRVSCVIEVDGKILLLQRRDHKTDGGRWEGVSVKRALAENPQLAVPYAISEQAGFEAEGRMQLVRKLPAERFARHYWHLFFLYRADVSPAVVCAKHKDYAWVSPAEVLAKDSPRPLVEDFDQGIALMYNLS